MDMNPASCVKISTGARNTLVITDPHEFMQQMRITCALPSANNPSLSGLSLCGAVVHWRMLHDA